MKYVKKTLLCLSLSLLLTIVICRGSAISMSHEEMFVWVAGELGIEKDYPMPKIMAVSKEELQRVFKKESAQSYQRWVKEYGENNAKKTMDLYLKEVIGLFIPRTKVIYVGSFLEPCRLNSIVAHEMTHYFQVMKDGPIDPHMARFDNAHFLREMQAEQITDKYMDTFCGTWEIP